MGKDRSGGIVLGDDGVSVLFRRGREVTMFHILDIASYSFGDSCMEIGIPSKEPGRETSVKTEHVVHDKHLSVASGSCSDADDRDRDFRCNSGGQGCGYFFYYHAEASQFFEKSGVCNQFFCFCLFPGPDVVCSEFID